MTMQVGLKQYKVTKPSQINKVTKPTRIKKKEKRTFSCPDCGVVTTRPDNLQRHREKSCRKKNAVWVTRNDEDAVDDGIARLSGEDGGGTSLPSGRSLDGYQYPSDLGNSFVGAAKGSASSGNGSGLSMDLPLLTNTITQHPTNIKLPSNAMPSNHSFSLDTFVFQGLVHTLDNCWCGWSVPAFPAGELGMEGFVSSTLDAWLGSGLGQEVAGLSSGSAAWVGQAISPYDAGPGYGYKGVEYGYQAAGTGLGLAAADILDDHAGPSNSARMYTYDVAGEPAMPISVTDHADAEGTNHFDDNLGFISEPAAAASFDTGDNVNVTGTEFPGAVADTVHPLEMEMGFGPSGPDADVMDGSFDPLGAEFDVDAWLQSLQDAVGGDVRDPLPSLDADMDRLVAPDGAEFDVDAWMKSLDNAVEGENGLAVPNPNADMTDRFSALDGAEFDVDAWMKSLDDA